MKNYRNILNKELAKIAEKLIPLKNRTRELTEEEDKQLLANAYIIKSVKKAIAFYSAGDFDRGDSLICEIPYLLVGPHPGIDKKHKIVGSHAVYLKFDSLRHYARMADAGPVGKNRKVWNNVLIIG